MHDEHDHYIHDHDHGDASGAHAPAGDDALPPMEAQLTERALRELLIEKGLLTPAMIQKQIDIMDSRNPALGAKVVARAWVDAEFRSDLIADPFAAIEKLTGIKMTIVGAPELRVVENQPDVHNVVVCTLCSCYPRMLLGIPPAWYKALDYRARTVREPRSVLAEFGLELPPDKKVLVHDSTADMRYLVLPERPAGTDDWSEEALAQLVTRDTMIGVAVPEKPSI